jgi:hypothetical protein
MMRKLLFLSVIAIGLFSCKKTGFITTPDAFLRTSEDTLHFDTVFTSTGSTTQYFKIFNPNDKKLKLSNVQLKGGSASQFKLNVDGAAGINFNDIEIEPNDSIYAFATVTVNPTSTALPFIIRDSIQISYNGNTKFVQLEAYGRNANFFRNRRVTSDTTWNNNLPFVILGGLTVDAGKTLIINKGVNIYVHADAAVAVDGTIKAIGTAAERISFQGDRLDEPYKAFPGSWPGVIFRTLSVNNEFQFVNVKNAYQGVVAQYASSNSNPKLTLKECVFDNIYDVAIGGVNSTISARNCQVTQSGYNIFLVGGTYDFTHCTIATYGSTYISHKNPVVTVSDISGTTLLPIDVSFKNCIIYGEGGLVDDEILLNKKGNNFTVRFTNVLYKSKSDISAVVQMQSSVKNQSPLFDSINTSKPFYDFRLRSSPKSPAIDAGAAVSGILFDLDGKTRVLGLAPDLGAYEKQ